MDSPSKKMGDPCGSVLQTGIRSRTLFCASVESRPDLALGSCFAGTVSFLVFLPLNPTLIFRKCSRPGLISTSSTGLSGIFPSEFASAAR